MIEVVKIGEALGSPDSAFGDGRGWALPNAEYRDRKLQVAPASRRAGCGHKGGAGPAGRGPALRSAATGRSPAGNALPGPVRSGGS
jgi:hypothetical protein